MWMTAERGRSRNTIQAYRRDLRQYQAWLLARDLTPITVNHDHLTHLVAEQRSSGRAPSTVARQIAAIRMLHRYLATEQIRPDDPTMRIDGVRVPSGIPKPLSEAQVTSLLDAVVGNDPLHRRDRALLELLYATGARVSEVVGLSIGDITFDDSLVRLFGKGSKERVVPFGSSAATAIDDWFSPIGSGKTGSRPMEAARRRRGCVSQSARRSPEPTRSVVGDQEVRRASRHQGTAVAPRATAFVCDPPARPRCGPADRARNARPRLDFDDPGVHEGQPGTTVGGLPDGTSASGSSGFVVSKPHQLLTHPHHLAARFFGSLSSRPPDPDEEAWAQAQLLPGELALWVSMSNQDRRHSTKVARRFVEARPEATRAERAGALLHDVGKIECGLGTWGRVLATIVGRPNRAVSAVSRPRGDRCCAGPASRFRAGTRSS